MFLILLFIVLPIAELYVIIQVGGAIGVWPTIALLLLDSILGALLLRSQGRAAWRRFQEALAAGTRPGQGGLRRRGDHLRRRAAADARLHHRHLRLPAADPADPRRAAPAPARRPPAGSAPTRSVFFVYDRCPKRPAAAGGTPRPGRPPPRSPAPPPRPDRPRPTTSTAAPARSPTTPPELDPGASRTAESCA